MQIKQHTETEKAQLNTYFKNRGIDPDYYLSFQLPIYLKDELPAEKNSTILDIGCGFGQMLLRLRDQGYTNLTGIDIGHESVNFCKSQGLNVDLIHSIEDYSQQNQSRYSLILMSHVLEHIPKEKCIDTLVAIRQMLAPGGSYIVMVPNAQSNTGVYWMYEDFTHHLLFTAGSLTYALQSAGFKQIEFLDPKCLKGLSSFGRWKRKTLLRLYEIQLNFWNRVTASSFHKPSPRIYSFELKAKGSV
jgi:2-polyprenyl-3-methyl-5-hydroxy-6-metoxy-1,4-benzoquinol methylase